MCYTHLKVLATYLSPDTTRAFGNLSHPYVLSPQAPLVFPILGICMRKGLAHMVWWYFHSCTVLNFTDGMSGVNHSLAGGELSLLLYLAVSSALYVLPSV